MMNRRGFLAAAIAAPWVVRSGVLMPVRRIESPSLFQGGIGRFDGVAVRAWSASLFAQVERPSIFHGVQWSDQEIMVLRSRTAPALRLNRIRSSSGK